MRYYRSAECRVQNAGGGQFPGSEFGPLNAESIMQLEVEQKFPIKEPAAVRQSLVELGATFDTLINQASIVVDRADESVTNKR